MIFLRIPPLRWAVTLSKLIVGCGYVGIRLARFWVDRGEEVWVTTRSPDRAAGLADQGFRPIVLDVTVDLKHALPKVETVVFAVGYDRSGPHKIEEVYVAGLRRISQHCPETVKKLIYLSSTGVYGQTSGGWVDEESPCEPIREGGRACLSAERMLQSNVKLADKTIILRLAGIYGPDRLPHAERIALGKPLNVAADGHLNLIHVDDIIPVIARCDSSILPPQVLCVSDGQPVRRAEFYTCLSGLLGTEAPTFSPPEPGSSQASRARGSKRIRNRRLMELVSPVLAYPSYREGLAAIAADGNLRSVH